MNFSNRLRISLLLFVTSLNAIANSPVWKVSTGDRYLYLGGTLHRLNETDFPLPYQFDLAYDDSVILVKEVDIERMSHPRVREKLYERSTYPDGESLSDHVSRNTMLNLSRHCVERNLSLRWLTQYRPGAVVNILRWVENERLGFNNKGVDQYFAERARADGKPIKFLDSVQTNFQLQMDLDDGDPDEIINFALDEIYEGPARFRDLRAAWRSGDLDVIDRLAVTPLRQEKPFLYHHIQVVRNHDWIPKIEKMLKNEQVEFVIFGTAHLVGDDGIITLLRSKGYRVENI